MIRPQDAWVQRTIEAYVAALFADNPGSTAGEQSTMEIVAIAKGCGLLILHGLK